MTTERLCVFCEHWYFDGGEEFYADTPGPDASMRCLKGHYDQHARRAEEERKGDPRYNLYYMRREEFRAIIETARECPDYTRDEA